MSENYILLCLGGWVIVKGFLIDAVLPRLEYCQHGHPFCGHQERKGMVEVEVNYTWCCLEVAPPKHSEVEVTARRRPSSL